MNEKPTLVFYCFAFIAIFFIAGILTGCRTTPAVGIEYMVEARILNAVNAERARWLEEHNRNIAIRITERLSEADARISAADGELQQVIAAAREYRALFLAVIDYLLSHRSNEPPVKTDIENGRSDFSSFNGVQN